MEQLTITSLVIALTAAILGFAILTSGAAIIAKSIFYISLVLLLISVVGNTTPRKIKE